MAVWLWKHQTWSGTLTTVRPTRTSSASRPDATTTTMGLSQFLRLRGKQVRTQRGTIRQLTSSDRDPQLWNLCQSVSTSYNAHGMFEWLSHTFNTVVTLEIRLWVMSQSRFDWGIAFHGYGISTVDLCELHSGWQSNDKASGVTTQPRFPCLWCMTGLHQGFHGCQNSMVTIKLVWEWHQKKKCMRVASEEEIHRLGCYIKSGTLFLWNGGVGGLTLRRLMSYVYIYGAPILDVSRSHTTTHHSR